MIVRDIQFTIEPSFEGDEWFIIANENDEEWQLGNVFISEKEAEDMLDEFIRKWSGD